VRVQMDRETPTPTWTAPSATGRRVTAPIAALPAPQGASPSAGRVMRPLLGLRVKWTGVTVGAGVVWAGVGAGVTAGVTESVAR
jgi:hypothetical protein